jgi:hypothetical protein
VNDPYAIARTLTCFKVFTDRMSKARTEGLNEEALSWMPPGTRLPALVGGRVAGWVSVPKPSVKAIVTDEKALQAFVEEHCPTEIETVTRVRESFIAALKESAKQHGGWVNGDGEVIEVPGLKVEIGDPSPRVEAAEDAFEAVMEALNAGELGGVGDLLGLPARGEEK